MAKVIPAGEWSDSATDSLLYWIKRPPEERIQAGIDLVLTSYRHIHGRLPPRMTAVARIFEPGT